MPTSLQVLILEDNPSDAELFLHELRQAGFNPEWQRVETEEEYLAALHPALDIIISDYSLPQFDGPSALRLLRARGLDLPFILVSGTVGEDIAVSTMKEGADDYLLKDRLTRLGPAVKSALEQKRLRDERKQAEEAIRLMSDTQREITYLNSLTDIYHLVGKKIQELTGDGYVAVSTIDRQIQAVKVFEVYGFEKIHDMLIRTFRLDPFKAVYYLKDMNEDQVRQFTSGRLERYEHGMFGILAGKVPKPICEGIERLIGVTSIYTMGFAWEDTSFGGITIFSKHDLTPRRDEIESIMNQAAVAIKRINAEEALRDSEARYRVLFEQSPNGVLLIDPDTGKTIEANETAHKQLGYTREEFAALRITDYEVLEKPEETARRMQKIIREGNDDFDTLHRTKSGEIRNMHVWVKTVQLSDRALFYGIFQDITERKRAEAQIVRQLQRITGLRTIDMAITSSFDLRLTLGVVLDQVKAQLNVDAADVLLFNPHLQTLEYAAGSGFRTKAFKGAQLRLGEGYAGRAALERHSVHIPNLDNQYDNPRLAKHLASEGFVAYSGLPLIAKGQMKGVLEVFQRAPLDGGTDWVNFLETLAGQAAIAIDNAQLFNNLERSNVELSLAYDATIAGWSQAMDLRDKETEGHTQRVTEISQRLARAMRVNEAELVNMRRGALLHDIGKMGVPDGILYKPGPLTDEEWVLMKKHPQFAFDMLSSIAYLKPALDIPYCHHEKWDGTGYPRGLKGELIPLSARIFSVVDVWDALTSDRPYRPAWPKEKVREHILAGSGTHFDPQVVEVFLKMMNKDE